LNFIKGYFGTETFDCFGHLCNVLVQVTCTFIVQRSVSIN